MLPKWVLAQLPKAGHSSLIKKPRYLTDGTLDTMFTCLNNFLNSVYVVYKRSTSSFYTMLVGAVVNLVLNFLFIRWFGKLFRQVHMEASVRNGTNCQPRK